MPILPLDSSLRWNDKKYVIKQSDQFRKEVEMKYYLDNVKLAVNELVAQLSKLAIRQSSVENQDRILGYGEI